MGRFYPLYPRRSDGKLETMTNQKRKELNQPTAAQLDSSPDAATGSCDYYRTVAIDEAKHMDWRRKLGSMLAKELGVTDPTKGHILVAFPEHYRLYEHVKTVKKNGTKTAATKTHAGGGNERQDAYLYGHPDGRKKRYRSPADFFPHLLWLCTDETGDRDNCACKVCCPEELDEKPAPQEKSVSVVNKKAQPTATTAHATTTTPATTASKPTESNEKRPPAQPGRASLPRDTASFGALQPASSNQPSQRQTTATPQPQTMSTFSALPSPRSLDQQLDLQYNTFLFRQGEMVWFNRDTAWGLGVITQRWKLTNDAGKAYYRIQPLSWPGQLHPQETKSTADLRPFLAWSVPPFTHQALNNISSLTWDTADWRAIQSGQLGSGDINVDGSILAAKAVDATYTTFALISRTEPTPGVSELRWNGVFIGAEKVWVGDVLRIKSPPNSLMQVLVVREIVERTQNSAFNSQTWNSLELVGDVFAHTVVKWSHIRQPTPNHFILPNAASRMTEEMIRRNPHTVGGPGTAMFWNPVPSRQNARIGISDVKGRWYEATLLLPLLKGQSEYDNELKQGIVTESGQMMNTKGDCNLPGFRDTRKPERKDALGNSVPRDVVFVDGVDPPALPQSHQSHQSHQQNQRQQQTQQPVQQQQHPHDANSVTAATTSHDPTFEFMDMDSLPTDNDGMAGFGGNQNYY